MEEESINKSEIRTVECYSCLQNSLLAYIKFLSNPHYITTLANHIVEKSPEFVQKLLALGLSGSNLANGKRVLLAAIAFLILSISKNTKLVSDHVETISQSLFNAITSNLTNIKAMKPIHYGVHFICQFMRILERSKAPEASTIWKRVSEILITLTEATSKICLTNPILSEYILAPVLKLSKSYISDLNTKTETKIPEKMEEEEKKQEVEEEEETKTNDEVDDDNGGEIKLDLAEDLPSKEISSSLVSKFGLQLVKLFSIYIFNRLHWLYFPTRK